MNAHITNTNRTVSAGTVARTAVLLLALTNQILSAMGKPILPIESSTVEQLLGVAPGVLLSQDQRFALQLLRRDLFRSGKGVAGRQQPGGVHLLQDDAVQPLQIGQVKIHGDQQVDLPVHQQADQLLPGAGHGGKLHFRVQAVVLTEQLGDGVLL